MTNEGYVHFMCDPRNICNCDACPERMDHYDRETAITLPCGQFHCWVDLTCDSDKIIVEKLCSDGEWNVVGYFDDDDDIEEYLTMAARDNGFYYEDIVHGCCAEYSYYDVPVANGPAEQYRVKY